MLLADARLHGLSRMWAGLGGESGRGHGPQDDGGAGCVFRGPHSSTGKVVPRGTAVRPWQDSCRTPRSRFCRMEAVGPVLRLEVCTPATGPPDKGRMGSRWRADVSRGGGGADGSAEVSLSHSPPPGPRASRTLSVSAGRGREGPGARSPAVFLHLPGSTGTGLLPDTAHRERREETGLLGRVLIPKGLFFPESSAVMVWTQV